MIHPAAVIHPGAKLGSNCRIGPCAVIGEHVELGPGCEVGPHAVITGWVRAGARNRFHAGCVIGDLPQDIRFGSGRSEVVIGDDNVFREHVTVHRSNNADEPTRIGSHCFIMASAHVGHNSSVGDYVIVANGALLGGHVTVQERVFISGNCLIHQFVRIGAFALMQGGSGISKDLPPYTIARGNNHICGLNIVGLRRAGFTSEQRLDLKRAYHLLFRSGFGHREALHQARQRFRSPEVLRLLEFLETGRRGFCTDASGSHSAADEAEQARLD
jgi:UDP-N-acetylglucosamine acyltransferase